MVDDDPSLEVKIDRVAVKAFTQDLIAPATPRVRPLPWSGPCRSCSGSQPSSSRPPRSSTASSAAAGGSRRRTCQTSPYLEAIVKETMRMHPVKHPFELGERRHRLLYRVGALAEEPLAQHQPCDHVHAEVGQVVFVEAHIVARRREEAVHEHAS
ncbi:hypothetical protein EJB05_48815, partial [Eragrostis curvula]